jgi:hypothetical protein
MMSLILALLVSTPSTSPVLSILKLIPANSYADEDSKKDIYSCPMHPNVKSHEPGDCPICHMKLQKISNTGNVDPKKVNDDAKVSWATTAGARKIKFYRNPMNPSVTSPTAAKDSMGMDYIPVYESGTAGVGNEDSTFSGRGSVNVDRTQFALAGAALVKVERRELALITPMSGRALSSSRVALQVREREISTLRSGLSVTLTSPALVGEVIEGKITSVDSSLDPMTRTLRVEVSLSRSYPSLKSESSVEGVAKRTLVNVIAIPRESFMPGIGGNAYVYVANESAGKFIPRKVVLGEQGRDFIEVRSGLNEGETISAGPNFLIDSESRIQAAHD